MSGITSGRQVHVNVSTIVNASKIRRETRNGREVIIVPSATLPDDIVMHGSGGKIRYPASVIENSYRGLEGTPAPLGHPNVNGKFVSASSPDGIVRGFIGAHNENVRREGGRVLLDKVVDVAFANQSEGGRAVLAAIDKQQPIHTSTGLLATIKPLSNAEDGADFEVESMLMDHDCFLLDQPGAATPEQGVGVFVNAAGDEIEVINATIDDEIDRSIDWSLESIIRDVERKERTPLLERLRSVIVEAVRGAKSPEVELKNEESKVDEQQIKELSGKVDSLAETVGGLDEKIAAAVGNALKPITDHMQAQADAQKAKAETEKADLVNKVVNAGLLDEDAAKAADAAVLNALIEKNKPGHATVLNGAFKAPAGGAAAYKLPEGD